MNRRNFVKLSGLGLAATAVNAQDAVAPKMPVVKIALIGCGGRGTGAAMQAMQANPNAQIVAVADAFADKAQSTLDRLNTIGAKRKDVTGGVSAVRVTAQNVFSGFNAFKDAIDKSGCDMVILATPPGFRPMHFEYAIAQGKHVFMEKPVAVDGAGIRKVLAAAEVAKEKNLLVQVGLQRRHEKIYQETYGKVKEGAIGKVLYGRVYWNNAGVWVRKRQPGQTEMEYQMRNWYYFNWLCGDHITEQHIHNLDVFNWFNDSFPISAQGMGGRQVRVGKEFGEIYDHHAVQFDYENGACCFSQSRHQPNTKSNVSETIYGSEGTAKSGKIEDLDGKRVWRFKGRSPSGHAHEWVDLMNDFAAGKRPNEAYYGAMSTLTSIMGRLATYSGKVVTREQALNSTVELMPEKLAWDAMPKVLPGKDGMYPCATPGVSKVF